MRLSDIIRNLFSASSLQDKHCSDIGQEIVEAGRKQQRAVNELRRVSQSCTAQATNNIAEGFRK